MARTYGDTVVLDIDVPSAILARCPEEVRAARDAFSAATEAKDAAADEIDAAKAKRTGHEAAVLAALRAGNEPPPAVDPVVLDSLVTIAEKAYSDAVMAERRAAKTWETTAVAYRAEVRAAALVGIIEKHAQAVADQHAADRSAQEFTGMANAAAAIDHAAGETERGKPGSRLAELIRDHYAGVYKVRRDLIRDSPNGTIGRSAMLTSLDPEAMLVDPLADGGAAGLSALAAKDAERKEAEAMKKRARARGIIIMDV
jgi:hypothetical protein